MVPSRARRGDGPAGALAKVEASVGRLDAAALADALDARGYATTPPLLGARECASVVALWEDPARFRSRVDMARFRFGEGEYRYFAAPLPPLVATLRASLYPPLARIANAWAERLGEAARWPASLTELAVLCAARGQTKPTPLLLRYRAGGFNCLHQDLYGDVAFPLQATIVLSRRDVDFAGGEFLLVEQRPRAQSRGAAVTLERGECIVFPVRERPVPGARGWLRARVRHGISPLDRGERFALGVIFHDAR